MKLISWNVFSEYSTSIATQAESLASRSPDIIALQEIPAKNVPHYRAELQKHGYYSAIDSFQFVKYMTRLRGEDYGELFASKWPLITYPVHFNVPWPEKVLSCFCIGPWGDILVHTAHIPRDHGKDYKKTQMLKGLYDGLAAESKYRRILCGDFGTPQEELADGTVITWGQRHKRSGEIVYDQYNGRKSDALERNILQGLVRYDLYDVYRLVNGYGKRDYSWYEKKDGRYAGRRYDHIFASDSLRAVDCRYIHEMRKRGLSDHSPVEAIFDPEPPKQN